MPILSEADCEAFALSSYDIFKQGSGLSMPDWEDLPSDIQKAWRAAVQDIAARVLASRAAP